MSDAKGPGTRHNSANSAPTSDPVHIKEVAMRTTFSHMINIAGIIYYTCNVVIDIQITRYKNAFNKRFNEWRVKTTSLRSTPNKF